MGMDTGKNVPADQSCQIKLPIGRSSFADIRENGYYFVDKSGLIKELLKTEAAQVTLITRPRRFGKTLGMRMLAEFFDIRKDSRALFAGLAIAREQEICKKWMNQYPVLFLTFKDVGGNTFEHAFGMLKSVISNLCVEHAYLGSSKSVDSIYLEKFAKLKEEKADDAVVKNAVALLLRMLHAHYGKPAILILDEYDVPVAHAKGYYGQMMEVVGPMIGTAVKDNDSLKFAVVTGCLRIAKESIFTGTNNFVSDTISDTRLDEYFGFTQPEVDRLLQDAGLLNHAQEIRQWYDGYRFGRCDVYCPWDVVNHVGRLLLDGGAAPGNYWENTSSNSVLREFLGRAELDVGEKFEALLAGGYIKEPVEENLTYDVLGSSEENLWSLLYLAGYLTRLREGEVPKGSLPPGWYALKIPNAEVMGIFQKSVNAWFVERSACSDRRGLFAALWEGDAGKLTEILSGLLFDTISYHDYRESFYHAFLAGLFANAGYRVESNYEAGLGRADLVVKDRKNRRAAVVEAKWTDSEGGMEKACEEALSQIEQKQYAKEAEHSGYLRVVRLGVAFYKKQCLVKAG